MHIVRVNVPYKSIVTKPQDKVMGKRFSQRNTSRANRNCRRWAGELCDVAEQSSKQDGGKRSVALLPAGGIGEKGKQKAKQIQSI